MKESLLFVAFISIFFVSAQETYLQRGTILDVATGKTVSEKTIIVSAYRIKSIQNGYITSSDSDIVIDLKDKTVLPGLIDMHVHMETEFNPQSYIKRFTNNEADVAFEATLNAKKTLMAGFTSVRDLGG